MFLEPGGDFSRFKTATDLLLRFFLKLTEADENASSYRKDIFLPAGKALAPLWAASCIQDVLRTKSFIRGTYEAIHAAQKKFPDTTIHLLYAGTGPFAALCLPLITQFQPEEIQFTFLEINPESIRLLRKAVKACHAEAFVSAIVETDATQFIPDHPIHILLSETMQAALQTEPQAAITLHLAPFILPGGFLIPQKITVSAGLLHPARNQQRMTTLSSETIEAHTLIGPALALHAGSTPETLCRPTTFNLPADKISQGFTQLCLFTEIHIFGNEKMAHWDSGLNAPIVFKVFGSSEDLPKNIAFQYHMAEKPGFNLLSAPSVS